MTAPDPRFPGDDPLLEGYAALLAAEGHGAYRVGSVYADEEVAIVLDDVPARPDRLLVLRRYLSGPEPDSLGRWAEPYVQARFRGSADRSVSAAAALRFWRAMLRRGPLVLPNGVNVMSIIPTHPEPLPIGRDENGRHEHTVNVRIEHIPP